MLTKEQKSAMIFLLATLDSNLSITSYHITRTNNIKLYNISSSDGEININISNTELENLSEYYDEILDYVNKSNDIFLSDDDEYQKLADIFNFYQNRFREFYKDLHPENEDLEGATYSRAFNLVSQIEGFKITANKTTNEDKIFAIAAGLCITACDSMGDISKEDIRDDLTVSELVHEQDMDILKSAYDLSWTSGKAETNAKLQKTDLDRIKLMIIATISPDTHLEITGYDTMENINIALFYGLKENGEPEKVFLHNRESHATETLILKQKLYKAITDVFDLGEFEDPKQQEEEVFSILKEDIQKYGDNYFYDANLKNLSDMIQTTLESNLGRESLLMETFTLTLATLFIDMNNGISNISKDNFSNYHLENIIKQNYELLKRNKDIFPMFAKFIKSIIDYRTLIRNLIENGEEFDERKITELYGDKSAIKNAIKDLVGIDNIPGNFDDLLEINEDTLEEREVKDDDDLDEMLDDELDNEDFDDEDFYDENCDDDFGLDIE